MAEIKSQFPLLIYAAGLGTRMGSLTKDRPKPLIKVGGVALIDHAFAFAGPDNVSQIVVNTHHKSNLLKDHLKHRDVVFSEEDDQLLETGGGLRAALPLLGADTVLTLNSDAVWQGPNPIDYLTQFWRDDMEALLLLTPTERAIGHLGQGDFDIEPKQRITRGHSTVYTGLQLTRTNRFRNSKDTVFSTNIVWDDMRQDRGLFGVLYPGKWCDVGRPESIPLAETLLRSEVKHV